MIEQAVDLGNYGLHCRYFKIAENSFSREQLLAVRNLVSTLFLAEAHYDIELLIEEFVHLFEEEGDKQAVSLLVNWFHQLMAHGRVPFSISERLRLCALGELNALVNPALDAATWEEFGTYLPEKLS